MDADITLALFDLAATDLDAAFLLRLATLPWPCLLQGETGTGKSLLAKYLASVSGRTGPDDYVSLAQLPPDLAISTICGHVKGAFTGAVADQPGPFELAHEGNLVLDEIGDCPMGGQGVLLRAVEEGLVKRLGEQRWRRVDVRVIACTNADLEARVRAGTFRDDLLARFGAFRVRLIPLRERRHAILPLAERFLVEAAVKAKRECVALSAQLREVLHAADWPENIRQLRGVCRWLAGMTDAPVAELRHLPKEFSVAPGLPEVPAQDGVRRVVEAHGGNKARAAKALGISRTELYRRLDVERSG